jgi:CDP-glycerol glycerophosphotransferase (TagB/SpsB family)
VVLYVPTFRESSGEHTNDAWSDEQQQAIDQLAARCNALFLVKLHPSVQQAWKPCLEVENLRVLPSTLDLYGLIRHVDILATDYSSIYFDYLLLDRPLLFYCYDLEEYIGARGLYFDFEATAPGARSRDFSGFLTDLEAALRGEDPFREQRRALRRRMHTWTDAGSARRLVEAVRRMQGMGHSLPEGETAS